MKTGLHVFVLCIITTSAFAQAPVQPHSIRTATIEASFDLTGAYSIKYQPTGWELKGYLHGTVNAVRVASGRDALGAYEQILASYQSNTRAAAIRLYLRSDAVLMLDEHTHADPNANAFPSFDALPAGLMRFSYGVNSFAKFQFGKLGEQGPWLLFDRQRNTMVVSPTNNFLVADLQETPRGGWVSSIDTQIAMLPPGFTHRTLLTFGHGINSTFDAWGSALQALNSKHPVANDADVVLNKFGYWTDNGATYRYKFVPSLGYEGTLLAVRDAYKKLGVPIAYLQLDSWWYLKRLGNTLENRTATNGTLIYRADPTVFPHGLDAFHQQLGLPLVTHARWIARDSPYRKQARMSNNVIIDPAWWDAAAKYLKRGGVVLYEQDWLNKNARPAINIYESHAFLANMAGSMAREGIGIQYCMALPGYFLASTEYSNLRTIRVSDDRFKRTRYDSFLYGSELAHAVGLWPWTDVFMSGELENLVLSTLSAGPVGTGDALDAIHPENLKKAMRTDSVILKPDTPLRPIDDTYLADASSDAAGALVMAAAPMVAMTGTNFGNASEYYLLAYARSDMQTSTNVALTDLGLKGSVYAWDWATQKGTLLTPGSAVSMNFDDGWDYQVLVPVNGAGIALLGDTTKIVPLARKRFTGVTNGGPLKATIVFAPGENSIPMTGYADHSPSVHAVKGKVGPLHYDLATHLFSFTASPGAAHIAVVIIR